MKFLLLLLCVWSASALSQEGHVRWLDPTINCESDVYPNYVNPYNVYAQAGEVLKKRRPDGILFFSANIVFGICSAAEKKFIPEGSRHLTVIELEKWPWQKIPFVTDVRAYEQTSMGLMHYNKLEIRVDEKLLEKEIEKKGKVSVVVGYHDFNFNGVRAKWIFNKEDGTLMARFVTVK